MNTSRQSYFLIILLILSFLSVLWMFLAYLPVLILTIVLGVVFRPMYQFISRYIKNSGWASLLSTIIVIIIIIGPVVWIFSEMIQEALSALRDLQTNNYSLTGLVNSLQDSIQKYFPFTQIDLHSYLSSILLWIAGHASNIFSNIIKTFFELLITAIALYYWFKDGQKLERATIVFSPLDDDDDRAILNKIKLSIRSVIQGTLLVALIQGIVAGVGYTIFGLPNPIIFGAATAISALVPGIGTSLILIPVILYLFIFGSTFQGVGMLIWGAIAVGLIDNFIGPRLMTRKNKLHPFLILLSVLGGVAVFGPIGFIAGPLLISFFFALLDIYSERFKVSG